jgi:acyl transferase domain-containing protein/thioesterase domain-containing protein
MGGPSASSDIEDCVAVVGLACRVPGAPDADAFWRNVESASNSIAFFSPDELRAWGVDEDALSDPSYVPAGGYLDGFDHFDAQFFGYTPKEAELIDPQHRLFLECAWAALEDAAYARTLDRVTTGLFASASMNRYFLKNLLCSRASGAREHDLEERMLIGPGPDYVATRAAYKLGLKGPAYAVQSACSGSLVAVCAAVQNLLDYRCDMALAGGVALHFLGKVGYRYTADGILSRDGLCRAFDKDATGAVMGNGVGVVVLKRLEDALEANDHIRAVIRGCAVNNDGKLRAGFTAPGIDGQTRVILEAIDAAQVDPADVGYVEAHGTGTRVGDAIEVSALSAAFRARTTRKQYCAIGSVKSNIGHLGVAAGVCGLIKMVLALENERLPATYGVTTENPELRLAETPFFVNRRTRPWQSETGRLLAGVSSFGLGGTNAHVVLEQAPAPLERSDDTRAAKLLTLSARTPDALRSAGRTLASYLAAHGGTRLADVAHTLGVGRAEFKYRTAVVAHSLEDAAALLDGTASEAGVHGTASKERRRGVVFMFPGAGDQYIGMATDLHENEPVFREHFERCCALFAPYVGDRLASVLTATTGVDRRGQGASPGAAAVDLEALLGRSAAAPEIEAPSLMHAAVFSVEFALARTLMHYNVEPKAMIGHSIGEYVAACLSGVFTLGDAVTAVSRRARLIEQMPAGAMLAVTLPLEEVRTRIDHTPVSIAAVNAADLCVVAGPLDAVDDLERRLADDHVMCRRLRVNRAFHSALMEPVAPELTAVMRELRLEKPKIPFVSNVTGTWITADQATDASYWARHLCETVRFADGLQTLCTGGSSDVFVEVGPGRTLSSLAEISWAGADAETPVCIATMPSFYEYGSSHSATLRALGRLWAEGVPLDWDRFYSVRGGRRISLPTYAFERKRYWLDFTEPAKASGAAPAAAAAERPIAHDASADLRPVVNAHADNSSGRARPALDVPFAPPDTAVQAQLVAIWQRLFGYDSVGIDDSFFDLGGHSLLALQFANQVWQLLRVELPLRTILEKPTIRGLCASVSALRSEVVGRRAPATHAFELELATTGVGERAAAFERFLIDKIVATRRGAAVAPDIVLDEQEWEELAPQLIVALKAAAGMPVYPRELVTRRSIRALSDYLAYEYTQAKEVEKCFAIRHAPRVPPGSTNKVAGVGFILSSARAGSTLLRVMLQGHPCLFCPPELHLAGYGGMKERRRLQRSSDADQGLHRAISELKRIPMPQSKAFVERMVADDESPLEVFRLLQQCAAPKLFVDKSNGYSNRLSTLRWIEGNFAEPKYIHLVRHPYAVVESVVRNRFMKVMSGAEGGGDPFEFAEAAWLRTNINIMNFFRDVPSGRRLTVRYEDVMAAPRVEMERICDFLGIAFDEALLKPYQGARMRDGLGDPNLLNHSGIEEKLGDAWKSIDLPVELTPQTCDVARQLGYAMPKEDAGACRAERVPAAIAKTTSEKSHSSDRQAAGPSGPSLVKLGAGRGIPVLFVHGLDGGVFQYQAVAKALGQRPTYGIEAGESRADSFGALAKEYVDAIEAIASDGPYCLAGWSMGGILAYEMARQLTQSGRPVPVVALIDSAPDGMVVNSIEQFVRAYSAFDAKSPRPLFPVSVEELAPLAEEDQLQRVQQALDSGADEQSELARRELTRRLRVWSRNVDMVRGYVPGTYSGEITLFRAVGDGGRSHGRFSNPNWRHPDGKLGWSAYASAVRVIDLRAGHDTICHGKSGRELGRNLAELMARAEAALVQS